MYGKYMRIGGFFVALEACLGWNDNIHNDSQLEPRKPEPCLSFQLSGCRSEVCQNFNDMPAKAAALPRISEPMSHILTQVLNIT